MPANEKPARTAAAVALEEKKLEEQRNHKKKLIEAATAKRDQFHKMCDAKVHEKKAELDKKKAEVDDFIKMKKNERDVCDREFEVELGRIRAIPHNQITLDSKDEKNNKKDETYEEESDSDDN